MASSISWLDTSTVEQKRMREILGLFTEKDSREELGLGQIRDAVADGLFPGTSTLHSRARYLLFIPWIYQQVSARGGSVTHARNDELRLIKALKANGRNDRGIIGADAGSALKTVPSSVYWSALGTYGILSNPKLSREQLLALQVGRTGHSKEEATMRAWRASMPPAPEGFPATVPAGMSLLEHEAVWLQERIIDSASGRLLAHLAVHPPSDASSVPWEDLAALSVEQPAFTLLDHARRFAETMQGAQLLYNLLIARSYEKHGFTRLEGVSETFERRLAEWSATHVDGEAWNGWDVDDFFAQVTAIRGTRVAQGSEVFVRDWVRLLHSINPRVLVSHEGAQSLIQRRERKNKGNMARIDAPKRLENWGGSSGAGLFVYRWSYVQTILRDIHDGLNTVEHDFAMVNRSEVGALVNA